MSMNIIQTSDDHSRLLRAERERDLYLKLLNLSGTDQPGEFIEQALRLVVEALGAHKGYLELSDPKASEHDGPQWWTAVGWAEGELASVREGISRGIIDYALSKGPVRVSSALFDPRFRDRKSVRSLRLEGVLCAPITPAYDGAPQLGVVYLQGRAASGHFTESDEELLVLLARHLSPLCQRLFERHTRAQLDPTRELRRRLRVDGLIGSSRAMYRLLQEVDTWARHDVTLLITGEHGTGKSELARVLHANSQRRQAPFVELNCATLQDTLLEAELFGYEKGAFTGADQRRTGKVAAANKGTLFLDEIATLSISAQAKLLQLLQTKQYYPLGSSRPQQADVRVIAATNANIEELIGKGRFRSDLFHRTGQAIRVPSLRERRDDITELAVYYRTIAHERHGLKSALELSPGALAALRFHEWPGNVRELANRVEAGVIRADSQGASQVEAAHIFPEQIPDSEPRPLTFQEETRRFQRALLERTLKELEGNVRATAQRLDLTRAHVYNLINSLGLSPDRSKKGGRDRFSDGDADDDKLPSSPRG